MLQVNATVIAGVLILLTISGVTERVIDKAKIDALNELAKSSDKVSDWENAFIDLIRDVYFRIVLKAVVAFIIVPFAISSLLLLRNQGHKLGEEIDQERARKWSIAGFLYMLGGAVVLIVGSSF